MKRQTRFALLFGLLFLIVPNVFAQDGARVKGTVTDEVGAKVVGANVTLRSRLGPQQSTSTNQAGAYEFANLRAGMYLIEIRAEGFATFTSRDTQVKNSDVVIDVQLRPAGISENVIITATGTLQRADKIAKVVSTLEADELDARDELTLAEGLRGVPGVRIQQQGSLGSLTSIRLRGQRTADTSILLDGLRLRDAGDINGSAASLMADLVPIALNHLEILRGSGSTLYGTHAIGGVINAIPDDGASGLHFSAGFEGGSLSTFRERLSMSGGRDNVGFNLGLHRIDVRSGVDDNDE